MQYVMCLENTKKAQGTFSKMAKPKCKQTGYKEHLGVADNCPGMRGLRVLRAREAMASHVRVTFPELSLRKIDINLMSVTMRLRDHRQDRQALRTEDREEGWIETALRNYKSDVENEPF